MGFGHLQGRQAGVEGGQSAAALGGKPGAEAVGAKLRPGLAAHGADDGVRPQGLGAVFRLELYRVAAAPVLEKGLHCAAAPQADAPGVQMALQQSQHICRLIGVGVDPPGLVRAGAQAQRGKPAQRVGGMDGGQQGGKGRRIGGEIPLGRDARVVQIAAAIARGQ